MRSSELKNETYGKEVKRTTDSAKFDAVKGDPLKIQNETKH